MKRLPAAVLALLVSSPLALAQGGSAEADERPGPVADTGEVLDAWRARFGSAWRVAAHPLSGSVEMLYGGSAEAWIRPRSDADWFQAARGFLAESEALFDVAGAQLVNDRVHFLPLGLTGGTDKISVRFRQEIAGVPVVGGVMNVLMDTGGRLLAVQSTAAPHQPTRALAPALTEAFARDSASRDFQARHGLLPEELGAGALVHLPLERDTLIVRPAWQFELSHGMAGGVPLAERVSIDAWSGELLEVEDLVHYFDVTGSVQTRATPGTAPDTGGNPETQQPAPYVRISYPGGTTFADASGNFTVPGNSSVNVTAEYVGSFNDVRNQAGADHSVTTTITPGGGNVVLLNPSASDQVTAQANAYLHIGTVRDFIRSTDPGDSTADFVAVSNTNLNDTCNAFFNGSSVNYFLPGAGCVNTAYSTVVAHEFGHWLNVLYGTGNGSDGMGEGNADVFAMYTFDVPIVGQDFCGSGCHIRNGNNLRQFCGDSNPGCYGQVHADGEVWGGAAWKVRENLNQTHGNSAGDLIADTLFIGWMNAYNQTGIREVIEAQWLTLDDDDGNLNNGTPNYSDIDDGFVTQGWPGFGLALVQISNVTDLPDTTDESGPYTVDATIVAPTSPPVASATLFYSVDEGAFQQTPMSFVSGDLWRGQIPGQTSPARVEYYVSASDSSSNTDTFPDGAPSTTLDFNVGQLITFFFNEFEGATDEGWSVGDAGDDATTGTWERVDPVATSAQPGDDHTSGGVLCWVTGQQPAGGSLGTNDVDGGRTTLLSPEFDATGLSDPTLEYWLWYSNDQGAAPGTDIFEVDLSANGGSSWTSVDVVGPTGPGTFGGWVRYRLDITDFLTPSANMRLRFVASDEGDGSIVEAALDDILGTSLESSGISDCNNNGIDDAIDIATGTSLDCNGNGIPDECEPDCDSDGTPDDCETDCNANGTPDDCESFSDCNQNGIPDECEPDCDADGTPDDCEADCNANGTPDDCESFSDCNQNGIPDECEPDCDNDGTPDDCETDCNANGTPDDCESFSDCNQNGTPDECEPDCDNDGTPDDCETDCNANGTPDDCESGDDCNSNGIPDECDIASGASNDANANGIPDECEPDCNSNGVPDDLDISSGTSQDCNGNGIPDECEPDCDSDGTPDDCETDCNNNGTPDDCESGSDCNANGIPDECEPDCDNDGTPDDCETDCNNNGTPDDCESLTDCNQNGIPDECDVASGSSNDANANGIPDECEPDCNNNGLPDDVDIASGTSQDCNGNGIPDECEPDCDNDGTPDDCEADCNDNGTPDDCESFTDCNQNGIPDECDIASGSSNDVNANGIPDECETDCNNNGVPDDFDLSSGTSQDCNGNGIPDECEPDCDNDGTPDDCETDCNANGTPDDCESGNDCNANGIPDECEPDCDNDGTPDDCEADCNANGTPDDCESFTDCNQNGIPDECDIASGASNDVNANGIPDECETDCNNNGVPDDFDLSSGTSQDCNGNGIPDECEPDCDNDGTPDDCETDCNANGTPDDCESGNDCNANGIPDECEPDCDDDGTPDDCEADCNANGTPDDCESFTDCNQNGIPDECDIASGASNDVNANGIPDECETDCNNNGVPDDFDLSSGTSQDCNGNGIPDECEPDCDNDGTPDDCETDCNANGTPDDCESGNDCNANGIPDECEPDCDDDGTPDDCEADCNANGTPDDCESFTDCNQNGIPDECDIASGSSNDVNANGIPDECETDCNNNGVPDDVDIASGTSQDCDQNGVPDECQFDCDSDGTPDTCEADCNGNGTPDDCESFTDCNQNGVPDECEPDCDNDGTPDDCETDCNGDGTPDDCQDLADADGNGVADECEQLGTNYCVGAVNSTGVGATIQALGSNIVADNDLTLVASDLPNNVFGLFYFGSTRIQVPFGDGFRCAGGNTWRLQPPANSGSNGTTVRSVNLTVFPANGRIVPGATTTFQLWYRDTAAGGSGFNLTDATEVSWQ